MDNLLTGIVSGIGGILATSIPMFLAFKKQKDAHAEAMAKLESEKQEALAKIESDNKKNDAELSDAAYHRLSDLCSKLENRVAYLEEAHKDCEANYKELKVEHESLKKDHEELKTELKKG